MVFSNDRAAGCRPIVRLRYLNDASERALGRNVQTDSAPRAENVTLVFLPSAHRIIVRMEVMDASGVGGRGLYRTLAAAAWSMAAITSVVAD
jgi:hypothetical protein